MYDYLHLKHLQMYSKNSAAFFGGVFQRNFCCVWQNRIWITSNFFCKLQLFLQLLTGKKNYLAVCNQKKKKHTSASCTENEINNETFDIKQCHVTCHSNSQTGSDAF